MAKSQKLDLKLYSWIKRGKQRREIIVNIDGPETPTDIAKKSGYSLNHTSKILNEFLKQGLVELLNPKQKTGRLYELKPSAKIIKEKLEEYGKK